MQCRDLSSPCTRVQPRESQAKRGNHTCRSRSTAGTRPASGLPRHPAHAHAPAPDQLASPGLDAVAVQHVSQLDLDALPNSSKDAEAFGSAAAKSRRQGPSDPPLRPRRLEQFLRGRQPSLVGRPRMQKLIALQTPIIPRTAMGLVGTLDGRSAIRPVPLASRLTHRGQVPLHPPSGWAAGQSTRQRPLARPRRGFPSSQA